jgi:hypothetical protein
MDLLSPQQGTSLGCGLQRWRIAAKTLNKQLRHRIRGGLLAWGWAWGMRNEWMAAKTEVLGENLLQYPSVHHGSNINWSSIEPGTPRWEALDCPLELRHGLPCVLICPVNAFTSRYEMWCVYRATEDHLRDRLPESLFPVNVYVCILSLQGNSLSSCLQPMLVLASIFLHTVGTTRR